VLVAQNGQIFSLDILFFFDSSFWWAITREYIIHTHSQVNSMKELLNKYCAILFAMLILGIAGTFGGAVLQTAFAPEEAQASGGKVCVLNDDWTAYVCEAASCTCNTSGSVCIQQCDVE